MQVIFLILNICLFLFSCTLCIVCLRVAKENYQEIKTLKKAVEDLFLFQKQSTNAISEHAKSILNLANFIRDNTFYLKKRNNSKENNLNLN